MNQDFETAFATFFEGTKKIVDEHYKTQFPTLVQDGLDDELTFKKGKKYVKIIRTQKGNPTSASVFAFIDTTNGNILKPASYNAPAKHPRGNIYDRFNGLAQITPYGPQYLR